MCEIAESALRAEQALLPFHLDLFDVDADPELLEVYSLLVPVTLLPNGDELHYRVDLERLRAGLSG